jgi:hypothetical protein
MGRYRKFGELIGVIEVSNSFVKFLVSGGSEGFHAIKVESSLFTPSLESNLRFSQSKTERFSRVTRYR